MPVVGSQGVDAAPERNVAQLRKHFDKVLQAKAIPKTKSSKLLFLEAVSSFADPTACVLKLREDPSGLVILQDALRCDATPRFMNAHASSVLRFLSAPQLAGIADGAFLHPIIIAIVRPSIFWDAFLSAFRQKELQEPAEEAFAWLLLQLVRLPEPHAEAYIALAEKEDIRERLTSSSHSETIAHTHKLYFFIDQRKAGVITSVDDAADGPGGRHDNDFAKIKDIAILPTAQEALSEETPFLRPWTYLQDQETEGQRTALHIDNQFRLLREDMLYELRDDLQVASGKSNKQSRSFKQEGLEFMGLYTESSGRGKTMKVKWAFTFKCAKDLQQMQRLYKPKDRKKYLNDKPHLLRHQSLACLMVDDHIVAFPSVFRDEDLMSRKPPELVLQFNGCSRSSVAKTMSLLPSAENIKITQIDTAVFSYEPVLASLQAKGEIPLSEEILHYNDTYNIPPPPDISKLFVERIRQYAGRNLKSIAGTTGDVILDEAQHTALLSCLQQRLATIQGPPGKKAVVLGYSCSHLSNRYRKIFHWGTRSEGSAQTPQQAYPRSLLH